MLTFVFYVITNWSNVSSEITRTLKSFATMVAWVCFCGWCISFSWFFKALLVLNAFSHWPHLTFLTFSWMANTCSFWYFCLKNALSHCSHLRCLGISPISLWFPSVWSLRRWLVGKICHILCKYIQCHCERNQHVPSKDPYMQMFYHTRYIHIFCLHV